jgi:hypothetical protein
MDHKKVQEIAESDPDSEDICLYDFVVYYCFNRKAEEIAKERSITEYQKDAYYCSLILLIVMKQIS